MDERLAFTVLFHQLCKGLKVFKQEYFINILSYFHILKQDVIYISVHTFNGQFFIVFFMFQRNLFETNDVLEGISCVIFKIIKYFSKLIRAKI